jgi:hypothetical protein
VEEQDFIPDDLPDDIDFTEANRCELYMKAFCRKTTLRGVDTVTTTAVTQF